MVPQGHRLIAPKKTKRRQRRRLKGRNCFFAPPLEDGMSRTARSYPRTTSSLFDLLSSMKSCKRNDDEAHGKRNPGSPGRHRRGAQRDFNLILSSRFQASPSDWGRNNWLRSLAHSSPIDVQQVHQPRHRSPQMTSL